jgi:hypothetical protein
MISLLLVASLLWLLPPFVISAHAVDDVLLLLGPYTVFDIPSVSGDSNVVGNPAVISIYAVFWLFCCSSCLADV